MIYEVLTTSQPRLLRCALILIQHFPCIHCAITHTQANDTFYSIPCVIRDQISNQTQGEKSVYIHVSISCSDYFTLQDILSQVDDYRRRIFDITIDIEEEINDVCMYIFDGVDFILMFCNQILDEGGFVGDVREQSSDIQEILDEYDTPRLVKAR